jgi:hypothetical protein
MQLSIWTTSCPAWFRCRFRIFSFTMSSRIFSTKYFWVHIWSCGKASKLIRFIPLKKSVSNALRVELSAFVLEWHLLAQMRTCDQRDRGAQTMTHHWSQCN